MVEDRNKIHLKKQKKKNVFEKWPILGYTDTLTLHRGGEGQNAIQPKKSYCIHDVCHVHNMHKTNDNVIRKTTTEQYM